MLAVALLSGLFFTVVGTPSIAAAQTRVESSPEPTRCPRWRRRLAPAVALLIGPAVHGAGSFVGCMRTTGRRLGIAQGTGFGMMLLGAGGLRLTGASRRTVALFASLGVLGTGVFLSSWVADVVASLTGGEARGRPLGASPWELSVGYAQVYDPQFRHDAFLRLGARGWLGRSRLFVDGAIALDADTQRGRGGWAHRLVGERGRGSSLDVELASTWQRFGDDGFNTLSGELSLLGRLDLADFAPGLEGSFVEGSLGVGIQLIGYEATGGGVGEDAHALLLLRAGYGVYLGRTGELLVAYDHRRDGLEGGLSMDSVAAGNIGFVTVSSRGYFAAAPHWGLAAEITYGSAWIVGVSLLHRGGR